MQGIKRGCCKKRRCSPAELALATEWYQRSYDKLRSYAALFTRRYAKRAEQREDAIEEILSWSWAWTESAARNGNLGKLSLYRLAQFAARMYSTGRRFGHCRSVTDVMGEETSKLGRVVVESLDGGAPEERYNLSDKRAPLPYDVARRNVDYGILEDRLTPAPREVFKRLIVDHERGCKARIARALGISAPAVSISRAAIARNLVSLEYARG